MRRKLGKFETAAALSGEHAVWNIVGVLMLEGLPSPELLHQALNRLQERHPFLRVRLIQEGRSHYFQSGDIPAIPLQVIDRKSPDHWVSVAEEGLNHKFDHRLGPLMKCYYLTDGNREGELILAAQHSIVDGVSIENLFHELLDLCVRMESNTNIEDYDPLEPLDPVEHYFPDQFKGFQLSVKTLSYFFNQMVDEVKYQLILRGKRKPPIDTAAKGRIILFHTPEELTSKLVARARKERVTLNSVVNAAVLLSVRRHLYHDTSMSYRYMSMADLRPYLVPVPPMNEMGCFISPLRYTIAITADDNLWSLSKKINTQINKSTRGGEKYLASVMGEQFLRMTFGLKRFRMCTTAISYGGASTRTRTEYGPYKIKTIRGFVSNFGLGPEFSGRVGLYDGELWWDMLYLDSDMDQRQAIAITEQIEGILQDAVDE
jgi:NRPS condensation-like uncharacterized protein